MSFTLTYNSVNFTPSLFHIVFRFFKFRKEIFSRSEIPWWGGGGLGKMEGGQKSFELPEGGTKKFSVVKGGGVKKVLPN